MKRSVMSCISRLVICLLWWSASIGMCFALGIHITFPFAILCFVAGLEIAAGNDYDPLI